VNNTEGFLAKADNFPKLLF